MKKIIAFCMVLCFYYSACQCLLCIVCVILCILYSVHLQYCTTHGNMRRSVMQFSMSINVRFCFIRNVKREKRMSVHGVDGENIHTTIWHATHQLCTEECNKIILCFVYKYICTEPTDASLNVWMEKAAKKKKKKWKIFVIKYVKAICFPWWHFLWFRFLHVAKNYLSLCACFSSENEFCLFGCSLIVHNGDFVGRIFVSYFSVHICVAYDFNVK